jgi:uracil-DNA glycosylase
MSPRSLSRILGLLRSYRAPLVFNPWNERDAAGDADGNGPAARRRRLHSHLDIRAARILIGEAAGYQGCHVSGIPFTSERLLLTASIARVARPATRLSTRHLPWSEPSATTVWKALYALAIERDTILWNAFPWHPHRPGKLHSNRTPTRVERAHGRQVLEALLSAQPDATLFAVGRHAQAALGELGCSAIALRHPSMGGAAEFCAGLRRAHC